MFAVPDNTLINPETTGVALHRHPVRVALDVAADRDRWRHLLRYDPDQRFAALVERTPEQEVWLMSWLPGQHTDLHDHHFSSGAFTVVSGWLTETVARRDPRGRVVQELHPLATGQSRVFGPGYVHRVRNESTDPAVSVHVYRGGRAMRDFRLDPVTGPERL